jgi:ubiquinone/menaquinone biosynthesis C-methylase UbiE
MNEGPVLLCNLPISARDPRPYGGLNIFSPAVKQQSTDLHNLCKEYGQLNMQHSVLDFGCGTGRVLAGLQKTCRHAVGFDICNRFLEYCQQYQLATHHADVYHEEFNPKGTVDPDTEYLPFKENSFDRVTCVAVMNHQSIENAVRIIKESLRVVKRGGKIIMTAFLLNAQSRTQLQYGNCALQFQEKTPEWWVANASRPYLNCALDETIIRRTIVENKGQIVEPILYGQWRNMNHAPTGHDLLVIRKV